MYLFHVYRSNTCDRNMHGIYKVYVSFFILFLFFTQLSKQQTVHSHHRSGLLATCIYARMASQLGFKRSC